MELETAVLKFTILRDGKLGRVAIPDVHGVALLYLRQGTHQALCWPSPGTRSASPAKTPHSVRAAAHAPRPWWERPGPAGPCGSGQRQLGQHSLARWAVCLFLFSGCHGLLCGCLGPPGLFERWKATLGVTAEN